jgi:hypothetical protein
MEDVEEITEPDYMANAEVKSHKSKSEVRMKNEE